MTIYRSTQPSTTGGSIAAASSADVRAGAGAIPAQGARLQAAQPARPARRVPLPRTWSLRASDAYALLIANGLLIAGMWLRHGGLLELGSTSGLFTAIGQLTALYATYLVLVQLVLMSRNPWLDQLFGADRLAWAHRWVGFSAIWLIVAHGVFTTVGYAMGDGSSIVGEFITLVTTYPYVLWATVSGGLFVAVAIASVRAARRRLSYETWYGIHLYTYLAIALGFLHQLVVGTDFSNDALARLYWIVLYVAAVAAMLVFRFGAPIALSARHRLRVANIVQESPDVISIYLTGRDLDRLPVRAGQFFRLRFLTRDGWWRAHPFSISTAPNGRYLRFTVKDLGDYTRQLQRLRTGTYVFAEGPYGAFTGVHRTRARVLLVAGGIGITPLRALLEELPASRGKITLLYRASRTEDLVFRRELDQLAELRGATVHYLVGRRGRELPRDPLDPRVLRQLVPDVAERDVYVCGPDGMMAAVERSLRRLQVPAAQIHSERFAF